MWPAFWMLGNDIAANGWPKCGEIDIMEISAASRASITVRCTAEQQRANVGSDVHDFVAAGQNYSDDFHVYAIEWTPGTVRFYVDSNNYATFTQAQWPANGTWVFDHPFLYFECSGRRKLAGRSRCHHRVSATDAGGLLRVYTKIRIALQTDFERGKSSSGAKARWILDLVVGACLRQAG